jgi:dCTP deaminase
MSFLADHEIAALGTDLVQPFHLACVEPASIDMHLSDELLVPDISNVRFVDLADPVDFMSHVRITGDGYVLHPGEFVLGVTEERVTIPSNIVGKIEGKSSLGRLGLMVHVTAGFIDPGFRGPITLEMKNLLQIPIVLRPGRKICQIAFAYMNSSVKKPYNGRYQDSKGVVASRYGDQAGKPVTGEMA